MATAARRLSFYDANYGGAGGYIDRLVNKINADGMVAIIDLHEISNKSSQP